MSVLSQKNQITVPVDVLRQAGLVPGDDLRVAAVGPGRIELVKLDDLIAEFAGALDADAYPDGYLGRLRSEWR